MSASASVRRPDPAARAASAAVSSDFDLVPVDVPPVPPGELLSPGLVVLDHLGRSRHGDVYRALDENAGVLRAVKVSRPDRRGDARNVRRIVAEAPLLRRIDHPNVVRAVGELAEPPGVVYELIDGPSLRHVLREGRRLDHERAARLGRDVSRALGAVHAAGYLHCDVKPDNVLFAAERFVLIDFDLAVPPGRLSAGRGTRAYMPPEQARGGVVGTPADVFGLGALLFRALAGRAPFRREEGRYLQLEARAQRLVGTRLPPSPLLSLVDALLEPEPGDRPTLIEAEAICGSVIAAANPLGDGR